jgi:hypothetical protein
MQFNTENGPIDFECRQVIVAGWTGRDEKAVRHHIDELAAIGVAPPSKVPLFYRVSNSHLTVAPQIEVLGDASSGEAEPLVLRHRGKLWLGLASDHTDRQLETTSVAASKQICAKPCATTLWDLSSVENRLERIRIKSWIRENEDWTLYQDGTIGQIRPLKELITATGLQDGAAMLCGTFAAIGGVRAAADFRATMTDPETGAEISLEYTAQALPDIS